MASSRGFQRATVTRILSETPDARTYVLRPHEGPFSYRAGQFCTFRVTLDGETLMRSYSMSSAPETDDELMLTVKRVPGGRVSTWLHEQVREGDEIELTPPAGAFCLRAGEGPLLGFSGGSGITPILSLAKSALATTDRPVRLLCADRDRTSAIFHDALDELARRHPDRLTVVHHFDADSGLVDAGVIRRFVGTDLDADAYLCGPEPFMDLVAETLTGSGTVYSERFETPPAVPEPAPAPTSVEPPTNTEATVSIKLGRQRVKVPRRADETILESARRAGLSPPSHCEAGTCATCIAKLDEGEVKMRVNEVLTDEEIEDGYILTCQGVPASDTVKVTYES
jgi:3-ketosteroid 9alpha-monooxygenase subunit B